MGVVEAALRLIKAASAGDAGCVASGQSSADIPALRWQAPRMTPYMQLLRVFYELMVFATHDLLCRKGDFLAMGAAMQGSTNHIEHLWFDREAEGD